MILEPAVPADVLAAIRAPLEKAGAATIDPPIVQPLATFLDLAGEAMRARLFVLQSEGREEACLRPDLTIPAARAHIASGAPSGRYICQGKAFRAAPGGQAQGHPEEFLQLGLEIYQAGDLESAEVEVASLAWRSACAGGRRDLAMRLGDAGLFPVFLDAIGLRGPAADRLSRAFGRPAALKAELDRAGGAAAPSDGGRLSRLLRGLPEAEAAEALAELWSLAGIQPVGGRPASEIVHRLVERSGADPSFATPAQADLIGRYLAVEGPPSAALKALRDLGGGGAFDAAVERAGWKIAAIEQAGVPSDRLTFAAGFGRAFGYYDGLLFDVTSQALGADRPIAGGGRYDLLLKRLGGDGKTGAVGCMVRPARAWTGGAA